MCLIVSSHSQSSRHSKLEKADILEMTVKHLRNLQRVQMTGKFNVHALNDASLNLICKGLSRVRMSNQVCAFSSGPVS